MIHRHRYWFGLAASVGALLICWLLGPVVQGPLALAIAVGAVALTAVLAGTGPALLALVGGYLFCGALFHEAPESVGAHPAAAAFATYAASALAVVMLAAVLHQHRRRTRLLQRQLEERAELELLAAAARRFEQERIEHTLQPAAGSQQIRWPKEKAGAPETPASAAHDPLTTLGIAMGAIRHLGDTLPTRRQ